MNQVSVEDMEHLICQLPTVLKCAVSVNDWGAVEEIHVLTSLERTPKQIVRDVESALLAEWNLRVDHKRISVAQITTDEASPGREVVGPPRLRIREYHLEADALKQEAYTRVTFYWGEDEAQQVTGEWRGRCLPSQFSEVVALAAVDAVNRLPGLDGPIVLSEMRTVTLANRPVMLVALAQYDRRRRHVLLIGTAEAHSDNQGATVRAVLDAVNRRVGNVLREGGME
ncbi:hypothetical protein [Sulfobacillus harzensis]|uniref:Uncharacterized protein n=1 Tax=Sulfobacillus harzensis TaxID=2729629 RepID=A0A7Y0Q0K6_9FIRM|nr:hypothetical protein [Sulfobacillus harzensis]NMP21138.1 hypothetical protein [Sulfobacillus harzensis]